MKVKKFFSAYLPGLGFEVRMYVTLREIVLVRLFMLI